MENRGDNLRIWQLQKLFVPLQPISRSAGAEPLPGSGWASPKIGKDYRPCVILAQ